MTQQEDDLLARELGKLANLGAEIGGVPGPVLEFAGSIGNSCGARFAARHLPTERSQTQVRVKAEPRAVLARLYSFFADNGRVADDLEAGESPYPKLSGVLRSGMLNMNPAVVHAEILGVEGGTCTVLLTAAAKEGLIKQRTAEKAIERVADFLRGLA